jgi:hypothetical protein
MNESAQGVAADKAEQPQDKEDYENCPEHNLPPENAAYLYNSRLDAALNAQVVRKMQIHAGKIGCNYAKSIGIGELKPVTLQIRRRRGTAQHSTNASQMEVG